jgi:hypothetical protein
LLLQTAIKLSKEEQEHREESTPESVINHKVKLHFTIVSIALQRCLKDIVTMLCAKYTSADKPGFDMMVRRDHVLTDAFKRMRRPSFNPDKKLIVNNYSLITVFP